MPPKALVWPRDLADTVEAIRFAEALHATSSDLVPFADLPVTQRALWVEVARAYLDTIRAVTPTDYKAYAARLAREQWPPKLVGRISPEEPYGIARHEH